MREVFTVEVDAVVDESKVEALKETVAEKVVADPAELKAPTDAPPAEKEPVEKPKATKKTTKKTQASE